MDTKKVAIIALNLSFVVLLGIGFCYIVNFIHDSDIRFLVKCCLVLGALLFMLETRANKGK